MSVRKTTLFFALGAIVVFFGVSYWYMVECEGDWDGIPLEAGMAKELERIEEILLADVCFLADSIGPRNPDHHGSLVMAEKWVTERWEAQGYDVKRQEFLVKGKECANLEVEIPGRMNPSEIVIVSAQYDTWPDSPGANNNASGMVVLMMLSDLLRGYQPDRTIRLVAFTTQEPPYDNTENMGSLRYAQRSKERGEDIHVILCMDAIGIYKQEPGTQNLPFPFSYIYTDRGDFLGFIGNLDSRPHVIETTRGFKKGSSFRIEAGSVPGWVKGAAWSDHSSFWKQGYPGIQITDTGAFRSASHTTSEDTKEKIDFAALSRITVGMYASVMEVASIEE